MYNILCIFIVYTIKASPVLQSRIMRIGVENDLASSPLELTMTYC